MKSKIEKWSIPSFEEPKSESILPPPSPKKSEQPNLEISSKNEKPSPSKPNPSKQTKMQVDNEEEEEEESLVLKGGDLMEVSVSAPKLEPIIQQTSKPSPTKSKVQKQTKKEISDGDELDLTKALKQPPKKKPQTKKN